MKHWVCLFAVLVSSSIAFSEVDRSYLDDKNRFFEKPTRSETIILLHGVLSTRMTMWVMRRRFNIKKYPTLNFNYWSSLKPLDAISRELILFIRANLKTPTYHLVAHSLGNLVIRKAFKYGLPKGLGRIVMLAPPNNSPKSAQYWKDNILFQMLFGNIGQQMARPAFYKDIPIPSTEFGVIAGNLGWWFIDGPNDGTVTIEETKLPHMSDFTIVERGHTKIMHGFDTFEKTLHFIRHGRF